MTAPDPLRAPHLGGSDGAQTPDAPSPSTTPPASHHHHDLPPSPRRRWLLALTLVLLAAVIYLQRPDPPDPALAERDRLAATVTPPASSPLILLGKLLLGLRSAFPPVAELVRSQTDQPSFGPASSADQLRVIMLLVSTNSARPDAAAATPFTIPGLSPPPPRSPDKVLDDVAAGIAPDSPLHADIESLRPIVAAALEPGATEQSIRAAIDGLTPDQRDGLRERHGWFADILFSTGQPAAPVRARSAVQGEMFGAVVVIVGFGIAMALLIGLILLILGIVWRAGGQIRSTFAPAQDPALPDAPNPRHRALWHETFTVFLAGFLLFNLAGDALRAAFPNQPALIWFSLLGQWSLLGLIFWPVYRGMPWAEYRRQVGWHAPAGPGTAWKEVGAGICAYLAGLPIYFFMAIVVVIIMMLTELVRKLAGAPPGPPPGNRVTEILGAGGVPVIITVFLLATVWAPIVEETIFRGALYRALRARFRLIGAGALSAIAFAVMHGYMAAQLLLIFTLGMVFAVMREWRNSIIPSATAHFVHNAFAMTLMLIAAWFMRAP